jgi:cathepsin L
MYSVAALLLLIVSAYCFTDVEYQSAFDSFKVKYNKQYHPSEETHRFEAFKNNYDFVANWDEKARGFSVAINKFADLTTDEFGAIYRGTKITKQYVPVESTVDVSGLAADVDWRTKGAVTSIKDQGQCGSCWAFSTTGSVEGAYFLAGHQLISLSEQNLVDCSGSEGNQGCNGGLMDQAFQYIIDNSGIDTESSYPYKASDGSCSYSASNIGATISSYKDVTSGDENALQTAANQQPISVAIDASNQSFQLYSSGVYNEPDCSSTSLDHGVLVIGYGTDNGTPYWLVKNSWGTSWGINGYIEMSRNANNQCGIATAASYPII